MAGSGAMNASKKRINSSTQPIMRAKYPILRHYDDKYDDTRNPVFIRL